MMSAISNSDMPLVELYNSTNSLHSLSKHTAYNAYIHHYCQWAGSYKDEQVCSSNLRDLGESDITKFYFQIHWHSNDKM